MNAVRKYIFNILTALLLILNFWYVFDLVKGFEYLNEIRNNADLLHKYICININITVWLIVINSIYVLILTLKKFFRFKKDLKVCDDS